LSISIIVVIANVAEGMEVFGFIERDEIGENSILSWARVCIIVRNHINHQQLVQLPVSKELDTRRTDEKYHSSVMKRLR
jgi:hypothetical protein